MFNFHKIGAYIWFTFSFGWMTMIMRFPNIHPVFSNCFSLNNGWRHAMREWRYRFEGKTNAFGDERDNDILIECRCRRHHVTRIIAVGVDLIIVVGMLMALLLLSSMSHRRVDKTSNLYCFTHSFTLSHTHTHTNTNARPAMATTKRIFIFTYIA